MQYRYRGHPEEMRQQGERLGLSIETVESSIRRFKEIGWIGDLLAQVSEKVSSVRWIGDGRPDQVREIEALIRQAELGRDRIAVAYATAQKLLEDVSSRTGVPLSARSFGQIGDIPIDVSAKEASNGNGVGSQVSKGNSPSRAKG